MSIYSSNDIRKIHKWIFNNIENKYWERHIDLHIDDINNRFETNQDWLQASIDLVTISNNYLSSLSKDKEYVPLVFISLYGDEKKRGVNFDLNSIESEYDFTPPSLFVPFKKWEVFKKSFKNRQEINFNTQQQSLKFYYFEEMHGNGLEYVRNICLAPNSLSFG